MKIRKSTRTATLTAALVVGAAVAPALLPGQSGRVMTASASRSSQGYLGVDIRDVTDEQMGALKLHETRGAEVLRVDHDGPAGQAGLREHDVILQINGQVLEGAEQLKRMLRETPSGRSVTMVISRDGQQQTVTAKIANREELERQAWEKHLTVPDPDGFTAGGPTAPSSAPPGRGDGSSPRGGMGFFRGGGPVGAPKGEHGFMGTMMGLPYTGALLEPMGPQLAEFFGVPNGSGLLVRSVEANSPAATAGMKAGDVVVKLNQVAVAGISDWSKTVHDNKGKPLPVTVIREKKEQTLTLTPDPKRRSGVEWPGFGPGFADLGPTDPSMFVAEMRGPMFERGARDGAVRADLPAGAPEVADRMGELELQVKELELETRDLLD